MCYNFVQNIVVKRALLFLFIAASIAACSKLDTFEKTVAIPEQKWYSANKQTFKFNITDTASAYSIYLVVRHTDAYKYNNLWLKLETSFPGSPTASQNVDLTLATDASGWMGTGMDDIYEYRKPISRGPVHFSKTGEYVFTLSQIMREDPLEHIMNVGIRVEKIKP
jgi:gliding motility-associated lipoprotein GldH